MNLHRQTKGQSNLTNISRQRKSLLKQLYHILKFIMAPSTPIRVGILGLSKTGWASTAHLPYLLSSKGLEKYQIVAVCNSSETSAREAIKLYGLSDKTKAYGDPDGALRVIIRH